MQAAHTLRVRRIRRMLARTEQGANSILVPSCQGPERRAVELLSVLGEDEHLHLWPDQVKKINLMSSNYCFWSMSLPVRSSPRNASVDFCAMLRCRASKIVRFMGNDFLPTPKSSTAAGRPGNWGVELAGRKSSMPRSNVHAANPF